MHRTPFAASLVSLALLVLHLAAPGLATAQHLTLHELQQAQGLLVQAAQDARRGSSEGFEALALQRTRIEGLLQQLPIQAASAKGDQGADLQEEVRRINRSWQRMTDGLDRLEEQRAVLGQSAALAAALRHAVPLFQQMADELVRGLGESDGSRQQLLMAARLLVLSDRLTSSLSSLMQGGPGAISALDRLQRESMFIDRILSDLSGQADESIIGRIEDEALRTAAVGLLTFTRSALKSPVETLIAGGYELIDALEQAADLAFTAQDFSEDLRRMAVAIEPE